MRKLSQSKTFISTVLIIIILGFMSFSYCVFTIGMKQIRNNHRNAGDIPELSPIPSYPKSTNYVIPLNRD